MNGFKYYNAVLMLAIASNVLASYDPPDECENPCMGNPPACDECVGCQPECGQCQKCNKKCQCVNKNNTCDECDNHGASCPKTPDTYCIGEPITVEITSPSDSEVTSGDTVTLSANAQDSDCYYFTSEDNCFTCSESRDDSVTVTWSAVYQGTSNPAGSFSNGNTGETVQWKSPFVCNNTSIIITA